MSRTIYLDDDFCCHVADDGTMTAIETDAFDGKCAAYIEGFRFVPEGCAWTRRDGTIFCGEMICPRKNYSILQAMQNQYEKDLADMISAEELAVLQAKAEGYDILMEGVTV